MSEKPTFSNPRLQMLADLMSEIITMQITLQRAKQEGIEIPSMDEWLVLLHNASRATVHAINAVMIRDILEGD